MLRTEIIGEEKKDYFNSFLAAQAKGHILQSFEWGQVKAGTGWQPLRIMFFSEENQPVAALTILKRKIPGLKNCIFYAPRGPVWPVEDLSLLGEILGEVKKIAKKHRAIFLKIDPDISSTNKELQNFLYKRGFRSAEKGAGFEGVQPKHVFRLDISPSEEELLAALNSKTRYNIRLAERKGVLIKEDCQEAELRIFYDILLETCARDNFLVRSYNYFLDIWRHLAKNGQAKLFMAEYEGEYIAGTLAFIFGDKTWYSYGASSARHRNTMPNYLLQWKMITWAKNEGCTLYDFRGVPGDVGEDHPLYGLIKFKRGFNGVYTEFIGEYDLPYNKPLYYLWKYGEPVYQKLVRKLIAWKKKRKS